MSVLDLAMKDCTRCGERKPLGEFYRHGRRTDGTPLRSAECKLCEKARQAAIRERRRALLGEAEVRRVGREITNRHRARTGNARGLRYGVARNAAVARLIALHREDFERLLLLEKHAAGLL